MSATPHPVDFAIRLADEGVPLRAIARAINTPSELVRDYLRTAKQEGLLVELPCEDWPSGFPRDQRALQLSRLARENKDVVDRTVREVFALTKIETRLLLALIASSMVSKERADIGGEEMKVHIHNIRRKLAVYDIEIETLRDYGYRLKMADRRRAIERILGQCQTLSAIA